MQVIDWGEAATIASAGIGMVAGVLVLLFAVTWLMGVVLRRIEKRRSQGDKG